MNLGYTNPTSALSTPAPLTTASFVVATTLRDLTSQLVLLIGTWRYLVKYLMFDPRSMNLRWLERR